MNSKTNSVYMNKWEQRISFNIFNMLITSEDKMRLRHPTIFFIYCSIATNATHSEAKSDFGGKIRLSTNKRKSEIKTGFTGYCSANDKIHLNCEWCWVSESLGEISTEPSTQSSSASSAKSNEDSICNSYILILDVAPIQMKCLKWHGIARPKAEDTVTWVN